MRQTLLLFLMAFTLTASAQFSKYFRNQTLRYDYYHSGSYEVEYIMRDEIISEGEWAGPRKNLTDPFDYGNHKMMVYDLGSGTLIYSRTYSSLFAEYQLTEQAKSECGNFPESMLLPMPKKPVRIEFLSRGKSMEWNNVFGDTLDPASADIRAADIRMYPSEIIHGKEKVKKQLDLVFLPEGYTAGEMDKFRSDCRKFAEYLFATAPYGEFRDKITVRAVFAPSSQSGTDIPGDSVYVETLFSSTFYTFNSARYLTTADFKTVRTVAASAPYDQVVILVNHPRYGGGGIYNFYAISTVDDLNSGFVFTHEFGHSFAGLGDEYSYEGSTSEDVYDLTKEPWEPNITSLVSFEKKWEDMLPGGTPVPTPATEAWDGKLGVFEGAGYMDKGLYKPYQDCSMNAVKFNNFCPVCQRAIREMVGYYTGH
jgi:hypothetical protein